MAAYTTFLGCIKAMDAEEKLIEKLADHIVKRIEPSIKEIVGKTVQEETVKALKRALADGEFYKELSEDVVEGVNKIYSEIHSAKHEISIDHYTMGTLQIIEESQSVLDNVLSIAESTTIKIVDLIEISQENIRRARALLSSIEGFGEVKVALTEIDRNFMDILTLLSFQDVTSQKIKKFIELLKKIEEIAFELHLKYELFKRAKSEKPVKDYEELHEEIKKQIEVLKRKRETLDQSTIDELLNSLDV